MGYIGKVPADVLIDPHVDSAAITDGTIVTADIANDAVTSAKLAANSVDSSELIDGSIDNSHLAGSIAINKTLLAGGTGLTLSTNTLNVDAAQSQITSVGTLTTLTVDNVIINGTTIGHTGDTDLLTFASSKLTVAGDVKVDGGNALLLREDDTYINSPSSDRIDFRTSGTVALYIDSSQNATFAGTITGSYSNSSGTDYLDGDAGLYLANSGSDGTMIKFGDTNAGLVYGGSGTGTFKLMQRENTALSFDASRNATFAGTASFVGMVTSSISGNGFRTIHASTTTKHTSLAYDGLYTAGAQHQYISSAQDIKFYPGGTNEVTFADGGLATFAGSITSGTHLIQGVSNYTGLEVKGSGGSRPQVKFTNANNGSLGSIYGTEGSSLVFNTGTSLGTALVIADTQTPTFYGNSIDQEVESGYGKTVFKTWQVNGSYTGDIKIRMATTGWKCVIYDIVVVCHQGGGHWTGMFYHNTAVTNGYQTTSNYNGAIGNLGVNAISGNNQGVDFDIPLNTSPVGTHFLIQIKLSVGGGDKIGGDDLTVSID